MRPVPTASRSSSSALPTSARTRATTSRAGATGGPTKSAGPDRAHTPLQLTDGGRSRRHRDGTEGGGRQVQAEGDPALAVEAGDELVVAPADEPAAVGQFPRRPAAVAALHLRVVQLPFVDRLAGIEVELVEDDAWAAGAVLAVVEDRQPAVAIEADVVLAPEQLRRRIADDPQGLAGGAAAELPANLAG